MTQIQTFAQISPTELGALIGILGSMLAGFYALLNKVLKQSAETQEKDRNERIALASAFERMAVATEASAREAEARNGHLAELTIESKKATLEAIHCIKVKQNVAEQHVDIQTVEHETLKEKE
jgi:membrane-bound ClpP family serine protease